MGLAFPLGLLAAALAGPLILLYVLKLRRRVVVVDSTVLWRRVLQDRRANAPWERLRRHLLLLLQLLALLLLVLAFAGPYLRAPVTLTGDTVVVLDASASMTARDASGATRMDLAKRLLRRMLPGVEASRRAALVVAGPQPSVAAPLSSERAPLQRAIDSAEAAQAPCDLASALDLALTLVRGAGSGEVVLVTDGAFDRTPALDLLLRRCRVVPVTGGTDDATNAGIVSLALRPLPGEAGVHELFVGVRGGGAAVPLTVSTATPKVSRDQAPDPSSWEWARIASADVVPQDGSASQLFRIQAAPGAALRVGLPRGDALEADDEALVVVPARSRRRVLLVSPHPFLLERALRALPQVELFIAAEPGSAADYDAVVVDGPVPRVLPDAPLLVFGGPPEGEPDAALADPRVLRWESDHPALRHARWDAVRVATAHGGALPPGGAVVVESDQGPLAVTWPAHGGRALWFRFDLTESDLPLRVAFPVLVADAVDWLTEGAEQDGVLPTGRPRDVAAGAAPSALLLQEGERPRPLQARSGVVRVPALTRCGVASLVPEAPGARPQLLAFALLSAEETRLDARGAEGASGGSDSVVAAAAQRVPGRKALWPWAVALAIGVLMAEWAVHHRRRE